MPADGGSTTAPARRRFSLQTRLLAVTLPLAVLAVVASAWVTNQQTRGEIREAFETERRKPTNIINILRLTAERQGDWQDIQAQVDGLAEQYGLRIAVYEAGTTDGDRRLLADSDRNQPFPDGEAYPIVASPPASYQAQEQNIEVRAYTEFARCLDDAGIPWSPDADSQDVVKPTPDRAAADANKAALARARAERKAVLDERASLPKSEPAFPSVDVYLGPTRIDSGTLLSGGISQRLVLIIAFVALLMLAATALIARRMAKPIAALTRAARHMADGNLDERVPEGRTDELGELSRAFNTMAASLAEADRQRRRTTTDIAHELRTPLSNIRGYLEAAQDGVAPLTPALVDSLYEDTLLLQALVDDLQELSLAESGQLHLERSPTDLGELATSVAGAHRPRADAAGIALVVETDPGADGHARSEVSAEVDARRIRQVLTNLIENAIRHTPPQGRITVAVRRDGPAAVVRVADTGSGIPPEALPHVFERFYRADPSRHRATGGSGLGLAITRELVVAHGGSIDVVSTVGRGTTFTVRLAALPVAGPAGPATGGPPPEAAAGGRATIPDRRPGTTAPFADVTYSERG